uniref:Uncharacterized protein n=1 Tax=Chromera velia CCMP2878 TaxID=1169474 RepID=A0A0G4HCD3_9ALVE|eukprot:Cvel_26051.t1-p1 / transcript=Cvel_26051.t1 / gene=Cvel_26051 / organism=Chromera_velia_CCMP2878 / gene_product=hypothetical protein / transcript_product=hypothetical protein / location=Cvel_scaffold3037:10441-11413(+) / protein_length=261 / sequence_SO=supercontig / SO=protein_coding / is_pseudo=false
MRRSRTVLHGLTRYRDVYVGTTMTGLTDCSPPDSIGSLRWCPQARVNQLSCKVSDGLLHFSTLLVVSVLLSVYSPHASTCLHCQFHPALFFAAFKGGLRQASDDQGASSVIPRAPVPVLETQESDRSAAAEPSADAAPEVQESPNVDPPTESLRSRSDVPVVSVAVAAAAPAAVHSAEISAAAASSSSSAPAQAPPPQAPFPPAPAPPSAPLDSVGISAAAASSSSSAPAQAPPPQTLFPVVIGGLRGGDGDHGAGLRRGV